MSTVLVFVSALARLFQSKGVNQHERRQRPDHRGECALEAERVVGVAQGIAYLDFWFIEPTLLATLAKTAKDGQAAPKGLEGALVTRVAMSVDVLARLHQQIQQVLVSMSDAQKLKQKA
jgi:hypothetical protein